MEYFRGNFSTIRDLTDRGLEALPRWSPLLLHRAIFEYESGESEQGAEYLDRLLETARQTRPAPSLEFAVPAQGIPLIAQITGSLEHLEFASQAANSVLAFSTSTLFISQLARSGLVVTKLLTGDSSDFEIHYRQLSQLRRTHLAWIGVDWLLGKMCYAMNRLDEAADHFETSLDLCRKSGALTQLGRVTLMFGEMLLDRAGAVTGNMPVLWPRKVWELQTESVW